MKTVFLLLQLITGGLFGCNPAIESTPKTPVVGEAAAAERKSEIIASALERDSSGKVPVGTLKHLKEKVPDMKEGGFLLEVLGVVPDDQLVDFREEILTMLEQFKPSSASKEAKEYKKIVNLARRTGNPNLAAALIEHFPYISPYVFPEQPLPAGWGRADLAEHYHRGTQGLVASTIVEFADNKTMEKFRKMLLGSQGDEQRVMIWALGKSPDKVDFDLLWELEPNIKDAAAHDTLIRALNAIPISMERVAHYPSSRQVNRNNLSVAELDKTATGCRDRLRASKFVVKLNLGD